MKYFDLDNLEGLIEGVVVRKLLLHRDESGILFETLRVDWSDVYNSDNLRFAMQYMSITPPGVVRDEYEWHVHRFQKDRFICGSGRIVVGVYDPRQNSKTFGKLNLFVMSPEKEKEMYLLVIPEETYHGFIVVSQEPAYLLNFPTNLYDGTDEGRVKNSQLDWQEIRNDFFK
ncbi:MAG: dTDP-4-dehydrorhamnose 3,5-epimerase family protein [Candidatus Aenigmatarchaeota archaeon]